MDTVLMNNGNLEIELLGESIISENAWYVDNLLQFDDGLLLTGAQTWKKCSPEDPDTCYQISQDNGKTWQSYLADDIKDYTKAAVQFMGQRSDGSIIGWTGVWPEKPVYQGRPGQPITQSIVKSSSLEALSQGQSDHSKAAVYVPYLVPGTGDDLNEPPAYFIGNWGKMVEAEHGCLLQAAYSFFSYDHSPRLWTGQAAQAFQYRTYMLYSQDDAATWHYLSTIASSGQYPLPAQSEGFCEPDLLYFNDGHLLCVMRSGGNPVGTHMERYTPLAASHSTDGGLTWTPPAYIAPYGVNPILLQMSNGLTVCLSGRPGFFLIFSSDQGQTWSPPHWLTQSHGEWAKCSSGYGRLIELEPGVLGIAYDEYIGSGEDAKLTTKFRTCKLNSMH